MSTDWYDDIDDDSVETGYYDDYGFDRGDYSDHDGYDGSDYEDDYTPPTRMELLRWRLESIWWKVCHPVPELRQMWRERVVWRWFRYCRANGCGKRGTVDGVTCVEHWLPF